jgi:3-deoxy-7-phosphoheptulonate synthase
MGVHRLRRLPTADELIERVPLSAAGHARVQADREEVRAVLAGEDPRLLLVVGPCSAWPAEAVLDYGARLVELERRVRDALKVVLRTYIQKPRTTRGWSGPVNQPDPFAPADVEAGMFLCRRMMVSAIELGLAIADEALFTHNARGFHELLAWVAIGARSSEDSEHRIWASGVETPVGLKNPTSGCIETGVNSVLAAQSPQVAVFEGHQVETDGNPFAHLVLRGGRERPNHGLEDLVQARALLLQRGLRHPALLVDASHDNCRSSGRKDPELQIGVVRDVLASLRARPELAAVVRGFLLESFLKAGSQRLEELGPASVDRGGLSLTDPCLAWEATEALVEELAAEARFARRARRSG